MSHFANPPPFIPPNIPPHPLFNPPIIPPPRQAIGGDARPRVRARTHPHTPTLTFSPLVCFGTPQHAASKRTTLVPLSNSAQMALRLARIMVECAYLCVVARQVYTPADPCIAGKEGDYMADFRDEMIYARMSRGYYQRDIARRLGIIWTSINRVERGKYNPSLRVIVRYLMAIGCKLAIVDDPDSPFRRDQA